MNKHLRKIIPFLTSSITLVCGIRSNSMEPMNLDYTRYQSDQSGDRCLLGDRFYKDENRKIYFSIYESKNMTTVNPDFCNKTAVIVFDDEQFNPSGKSARDISMEVFSKEQYPDRKTLIQKLFQNWKLNKLPSTLPIIGNGNDKCLLVHVGAPIKSPTVKSFCGFRRALCSSYFLGICESLKEKIKNINLYLPEIDSENIDHVVNPLMEALKTIKEMAEKSNSSSNIIFPDGKININLIINQDSDKQEKIVDAIRSKLYKYME